MSYLSFWYAARNYFGRYFQPDAGDHAFTGRAYGVSTATGVVVGAGLLLGTAAGAATGTGTLTNGGGSDELTATQCSVA